MKRDLVTSDKQTQAAVSAVFGLCQEYLSCEMSSSHSGGAEVQVFWHVTPCHWASSSRRFEASHFPYLHGQTTRED
jgi:hypothetical protein